MLLKKFFLEEEGQGLTEYGLIVVAISVACIGVWLLYRNTLKAIFLEPSAQAFQNVDSVSSE